MTYSTGEVTLTLSDNQKLRYSIDPVKAPGPELIESSEAHFSDRLLRVLLVNGSTLEVELPPADGRPSPRQERPVVYLDQNKWISVARVLNGKKATPETEAAARWVEEAVDAGRLILPLSAGHHIESSIRSGDSRQKLALTMLRLSRGWVLTHPNWVRREELSAMAQSQSPILPTDRVISTFQWWKFADLAASPDVRAVQHLPRILVPWWAAMTSVMVSYGELLDPEGLQAQVVKAKPAAWAEEMKWHSQMLDAKGISSAKRREYARGLMRLDMLFDIWRTHLAAGRDPNEFEHYYDNLRHNPGRLKQAPFISRWLSVAEERFANPQEPWKDNDLFDMAFLSCAAAYCDIAVMENRTADHLRRAERDCPPGAEVLSRIEDLPAALS